MLEWWCQHMLQCCNKLRVTLTPPRALPPGWKMETHASKIKYLHQLPEHTTTTIVAMIHAHTLRGNHGRC